MILRVVVPGEPFPQPRQRMTHLRRGKRGPLVTDARGNPILHSYMPKDAAEWRRKAQGFMQQSKARAGISGLMLGPLRVTIWAIFACPPSDERKRVPRPRRVHATRPDADNLQKSTFDAANKVIWKDDGQVADLIVHKRIAAQGKPARLVILVEAMDETVAPDEEEG